MNTKRKLFALIMSAVLVLTLMPAAAFAGDSVPGTSGETTEGTESAAPEGTGENNDQAANGSETGTDQTAGDRAASDQTAGDTTAADQTANSTDQASAGESTGTTDAAADNEQTQGQTDEAAEYPVPVSVEYSGGDMGIVGTNELQEPGNDLYKGIYTNNHTVRVIYSDDTYKTYECLNYSYKDSKGKTVKGQGFILNETGPMTENGVPGDGTKVSADPSKESSFVDVYLYEEEKIVFKEGENKVRIQVNVPYTVKDEETGKDATEWKVLYSYTYVMCKYYKPGKITFFPAKGFAPNVYVGYNYIDEETFYGKGNYFEVFYKEVPDDPDVPYDFGYTLTYKYVKKNTSDGLVEGFYEDGNINKDRFGFSEGIDCELKKGKNKISLSYVEYIPEIRKDVTTKFTYNLTASKYNAYANWPIFNYTGKNISKKAFLKKLVVRDSLGKKISKKAYTVSWKKRKKMGWYTVTIKFKDKKKYIPSITADFGIGPKTPKITKVSKGKKKLRVRWKKLTKKQLKKIDGAYIEISTDKNFLNNYKKIKVSKKQLKKKYKVIKKLKKNKKYYVRMYTYKKIKQGGETFQMWSEYSNVKSKKTKK